MQPLKLLTILILILIPLNTLAYTYYQPYYNGYYNYYYYNPHYTINTITSGGYDDYYAHLPSNTTTHNYETARCGQIQINTPQTYIQAGQNGKLQFTVQNFSDQTFHIGNITIYTNNTDLIVRNPTYTKDVPAHGETKIEAYIKAMTNADNKTRSGTIRLNGYFENGKSCDTIEIGETNFLVTTQSTKITQTTKNYNNYNPSYTYLTTKNGKKIEDITKTENNTYMPSTWRTI